MFLAIKKNKGFTLIELLVVIAIIGLLSSVVLASLNSARKNARDTKRKVEMLDVKKALEAYYSDNGSYPVTTTAGWNLAQPSYWNGHCLSTTHAVNKTDDYIPGLTPKYISVLPKDDCNRNLYGSGGYYGYFYRSDGAGFKLINYAPETQLDSSNPFYDPIRTLTAWRVYGGTGCTETWTTLKDVCAP